MNNLKRVLSLVMSGAMLVGMLTVGASAANTTFSDKDEITHTEAVNTMAALGVIKGKDTGAYDPKGNVTRAEMAKIICVMLNGGEDPAWGTDIKTTFTDTQNHWAKNYIAYCANKGIIAGQGDGTFNPDGNVTGAQAAKMMLVALDYDPDIFKLVGNKWEDNTNAIASEKGLYKSIKGLNTSAALNRDDAAQMAYNCLEAKPMVKSFESIAANGEITYKYAEGDQKFLAKYFEADKFVGSFDGTSDTLDIKDGYIQVTGKIEGDNDKTIDDRTFPAELDFSFIGEEVKVLFKDKNNNGYPDSYDEIYGVYPTGETEVLNVLAGDVEKIDKDTEKIKIDGTKYTVATDDKDAISFKVTFNYFDKDTNTGTKTSTSDIVDAVTAGSKVDSVKFILKDGDVVSAFVVQNKIARVVSATSSKLTLLGEKAFDVKDNDVEEGLKKDDVVVYNKLFAKDADKATMIVKKAEVVEGTLKGYKANSAGDAVARVTVDGTNYDVVELKSVNDDCAADNDILGASPSIALDDTVKMYLVEGKVLALEGVDTDGESNYAVIYGSNKEALSGDEFNVAQVKAVLADGTEKIFTLHKDSHKAEDKPSGQLTDEKGTLDVDSGALLVKYVMKGEKMKITAFAKVGANDVTGAANVWDEDSLKLTYDTDKDDKAVASASAKLFVKSGDDYKIHNLRSLGSFKMNPNGKVQYFTNNNGQITYAYLTRTTQPGSTAQDSIYGIVSATNGTHKVGDDTYYYYTVKDGTGEEYEVNLDKDDADSLDLAKGDIVTFKEKADSIYAQADITPLATYAKATGYTDKNAADWTIVAVDSYKDNILSYFTATVADGDTAWKGNGKASSVAVKSDVEIRYVSADPDDVGDGTANDVAGFDVNTGYANAMFHVNDNDVVDVIIVETSGEISLSSTFPTK